MITVQKQELLEGDSKERLNSVCFELRGLSTDDKPVGNINGTKIANGSVFIEIDTQEIYLYDESSSSWIGGEE